MAQIYSTYRSTILRIFDLVKLRLPNPQRQLYPNAQGQSYTPTE